MSMATSLEVRVPILDHGFAEWATGLPIGWKLRGNEQKYILGKLANELVSREALYRKKQGFAMPLVHWMKHELEADHVPLLDSRTLQRGYLSRQPYGSSSKSTFVDIGITPVRSGAC